MTTTPAVKTKSDEQRIKEAIDTYKNYDDACDPECAPDPHSNCTPEHEGRWHANHNLPLDVAETLTGKPTAQSSKLMKAAYAYRDANKVYDDREAEYKAHLPARLIARRLDHWNVDLDCSNCEAWHTWSSEYMRDGFMNGNPGPWNKARQAFEALYDGSEDA